MEKYAHTSEDGTRKQTVAEHLMGTAGIGGLLCCPWGSRRWPRPQDCSTI